MTTEHNRNGALCPACGEGHLSSQLELNEVEYNGQVGNIQMHFSICDHCGSELANAAEAKLNKRIMNTFKKTVDGLLSGVEIRAFRKANNLKQDICVELFGGGAVAFSRYENDDIVQSIQMDNLIRLCIEDAKNIERIAARKSIQLQSKATTYEISFSKMLAEFLSPRQETPKSWAICTQEPANDPIFEQFAGHNTPDWRNEQMVM